MRRLLPALLLLAVVPAPARAVTQPPLRAYVLERVSDDATPPGVAGGAGADNHQYAFAAVASANVNDEGRFDAAEGVLFFGATAESDPYVTTPATGARCSDVPPASSVCGSGSWSGAAIAFIVWWDGPVTFNRVVVVMRGMRQGVKLVDGVRGWVVRPWKGTVREVGGDLASASATPYGGGGFTKTTAVGGPGGSVAIGHPPCAYAGTVSAGTGAVRLSGGPSDVVSACPAPNTPPASAMPGSTEWQLDGGVVGVADVPARLVVVERR
jgi:hypothetical protein